MDKKVSFVVPVYNVEKYLENCINSILNQTYKNIELILVNDGSPDNSQKIIDKYKKKDNRIISIIKDNGGVSSARNEGLKNVTGEYIIFVDSDDFIDSNYVSCFLDLIVNNDADLVISYNYYDEKNLLPQSNNNIEIINKNDATYDLYMGKTGVAVWNKIYKKDIIDKYNIKFNTDFWFAEGMTFNIEYFQKCQKIVKCNKKLYHQTPNPESAVRKFNINSWYCGMKAMKYQLKYLDPSDDLIQNAWGFHYYHYYYSILSGIYTNNLKKDFKKDIKNCKKNIKKIIPFCFKLKFPFKSIIKWTLISFFPDIIIPYLSKKGNY